MGGGGMGGWVGGWVGGVGWGWGEEGVLHLALVDVSDTAGCRLATIG